MLTIFMVNGIVVKYSNVEWGCNESSVNIIKDRTVIASYELTEIDYVLIQ